MNGRVLGIRTGIAKATSAVLTFGLRHIARRPAANLPGTVALKIDPSLISELRDRVKCGSVVVAGTNGKTTANNLLANIMEQAGRRVLCNRTGANLKTGITTALLHTKSADWASLECDELWLAKVLPELQPDFLLLLNLFRDQLDRCGEIDRIQDSIVSALESSPKTRLIYNADDPLCEMVAERAAALDSRKASPKSVAFGVTESMNLEQNRVTDATMCQRCSHMFEYRYRQYGQLGDYVCPNCGFARPHLDFAASDIEFARNSVSFVVNDCMGADSVDANDVGAGAVGVDADEGVNDDALANASADSSAFKLHANFSGSYMVYNLLAVSAAAILTGCQPEDIQQAIDAFNPKNGRLQEYTIDGRYVLLNLAKNPTGFNQNLRIVESDKSPHAVAFFINDKVVDGHDISWIWDIDFEELASREDAVVYAGGNRRNDLQVRLKYAGIKSVLVDGIEEVFDLVSACPKLGSDSSVYAIANYTALPAVHDWLDAHDGRVRFEEDKSHATDDVADELADRPNGNQTEDQNEYRKEPLKSDKSDTTNRHDTSATPVVIAHILPDLLNLYGDGGNVRVLEQRLVSRGIPVRVICVEHDDAIDFSEVDLVVLGGSPDKEQRLASERLQEIRDDFAEYIDEEGSVLAICGSYQMLGRTWLLDGEEVPGLSILDIDTRRPGTSADRLVDNIALVSPIATHPVIGYENHAGRTYLDEGVEPFGRVVSRTGKGNADDVAGQDLADGVLYKNVIGTYLHGPLLSKNPEVADWLLQRALIRNAKRNAKTNATADATTDVTTNVKTDAECTPSDLGAALDLKDFPLDDSEEIAANDFMRKRII